ncbi:MAG: M23 family metallopeptidase [Deltaproteobacteria bacterium]|nr:M23 family metallopeptidase [Deltaproteobacteria bacterium]
MRYRGLLARLFFAVFFIVTIGCAHDPVAPLKLSGVWHAVEFGDKVSSVAERYGADPDAVSELNDLPKSGSLAGRQEVFVPKKSGEKPGTGASPAAAAAAVGTPTSTIARRDPAPKRSSGGGAGARGKCGKGGRPCLGWPADGKVSASFGKRSGSHHDGIDILAKRGGLVRSAADGKVLYSGDEITGYGNLVIIRHTGDIITVYARNDKNLVREGDSVKRGDKVARVGSSGSTTGVHLHFEVRVKEQPQNPLLYLPTR